MGESGTDWVMVSKLLADFRARGVRISLQSGGHLRYSSSKGALSEIEFGVLREHKPQILALLQRAGNTLEREAQLVLPSTSGVYPVAYSQLAHWNLYQLASNPSNCLAPAVIRMQGRLDLGALRVAFESLVERHEALRTLIWAREGDLAQSIAPRMSCPVEVDDLRGIQECGREAETIKILQSEALAPIRVSADPLFRFRLVRLAEEHYVLIVAVEHIITDGFSMNLLLRDLLSAYRQIVVGHEPAFPDIALQFVDYAIWQRNQEGGFIERHAPYWTARFESCGRLRFPDDSPGPGCKDAGWGVVPIEIRGELLRKLRALCRMMGTTLVMSVFSAYIVVLLEWCRVSEAVVLFQVDNRVNENIENTVGYFASVLYLRVRIHTYDTIRQLISRLTEEYCNARDHADLSFLESRLPRPEFTRNPCFNWFPDTSPSRLEAEEDSGLTCSRFGIRDRVLTGIERDTEPMVGFIESADGVLGGVQFPLSRFSFATMERFARNLIHFLTNMVPNPNSAIGTLVDR